MAVAASFAHRLITWQRRHGRRDLPWQGTRDPYRVWLSEVMLQQTQVSAVIPYYKRFLRKYPTVQRLAAASEEEVLQLWSGLGYYARGRNLHLAAQKIAFDLKGEFPASAEQLAELPGVGRSTAAAIAAFAFGERAAILDGNVKRVLARYFGVAGWPGERTVETRLWSLAEKSLPAQNVESYTQAVMDLGATLCTKANPACARCPVRAQCVASRKGLTGSIPASRPKAALPTRKATWFVVRHNGKVLLEKRPSAGLWGGLWTFPESRARLVFAVKPAGKLPRLEHGFTHFRLEIQPLLFEARAQVESPGMLWLDVEDARGAAVPAPVKKLLARLKGSEQEGHLL